MNKRQYRQGDVILIAVDGVPQGALVKREQGGIVLAHGEVTGHRHRIPSRSAKLYRDETDRRFLMVGGGGVRLLHEEHAPIAIQPGNYEVRIQREYHPEAIRVVTD